MDPQFRVGMQLGLNIKAKFTTTGSYSIPATAPGANGVTFDDGYVLPDISGSPDDTWNWGYNNASQLNGDTLTFQRTTGFDVQNGGTHTAKDDPYLGFDMGYGWSFARWGSAKVGAELGVGILPISITDSHSFLADLSTETFDVDTTGVIIPENGYHGSFEGPGVLIPRTLPPGGAGK